MEVYEHMYYGVGLTSSLTALLEKLNAGRRVSRPCWWEAAQEAGRSSAWQFPRLHSPMSVLSTVQIKRSKIDFVILCKSLLRSRRGPVRCTTSPSASGTTGQQCPAATSTHHHHRRESNAGAQQAVLRDPRGFGVPSC